jgi:hypothetical protein
MPTREELCRKIIEVFPDIGQCGIDVAVDWDEKNQAWTVDLKRGKEELKTFLETDEADQCMEGRQCVSLGLQISQLRANIESKEEEKPKPLHDVK